MERYRDAKTKDDEDRDGPSCGLSDPSPTLTDIFQTGKLSKRGTKSPTAEDKARRSQQTWEKTSNQPRRLDTTDDPSKQWAKCQTSSLPDQEWPRTPLNTPAPPCTSLNAPAPPCTLLNTPAEYPWAETLSGVQEWEERVEKGQAGMLNREQQGRGNKHSHFLY